MSHETHDVGDLPRIEAVFTDSDTGATIDPDTVTFRVRAPDGVVTDYSYPTEVTKTAVGVYHVDIDVDQPGKWRWRVFSTGNGQTAEATEFSVRVDKVVT